MNIGLLGYGKMGKEVEKAALKRGHRILWKSSAGIHDKKIIPLLKDTDVIIEFSRPDAAEANIRFCIDNNIPVVSGTTGWLEKYPEVAEYCRQKNGSMMHSTNFSMGVNMMFAVNTMLSSLMAKFPEYSATIEEIHHIRKLDAPSGTAISLAEQIISQHNGYKGWTSAIPASENQLPIISIRTEEVPGTHTITWKSETDAISFTHEAFSRKGFADGAVLAADWIKNRTGVFSMNDFLHMSHEA